MKPCCPPSRGCNARERREPCVLELCREAAPEYPAAALAVARWDVWQQLRGTGRSGRELRFHRRAYERARDRTLAYLLMRTQAAAASVPDRRARRPRLRGRSGARRSLASQRM